MGAKYAIKNSKTGNLFAGFGKDGQMIWGGENQAKSFSQVEAQAQASLLRRFGIVAQAKPVTL